MPSDTLHASDVLHLLRVQVSLSYQVVLHVAEHEAVVAFTIDEVAHTLDMVELSLREVTLDITLLTIAYLFKELVSSSIKDQVAVVRRVSDYK